MQDLTSSPCAAAPPETPASLDGFDARDACHRQALFTLGKLAALVTRLKSFGVDEEARTLAAEIVHFFATTARRHHEDEEQHVFPPLLNSGDPHIVQAVLRLLQDHFRLEVGWEDLSPRLAAVADGSPCPDLNSLHERVEKFAALSHAHIALEESCIYPGARNMAERADSIPAVSAARA